MPADAIPTTVSRPVILTPWTPRWDDEYRAIAAMLQRAAGDAVLRIDHIGSTSIPGLAAKDVIDVQLTVADLGACDTLVRRLRTAGCTRGDAVEYDSSDVLPPDDAQLAKRYMREPAGTRRTHLHIRELGRVNQRHALLFRDYLRATPVMRDQYATVKRRAAMLFPQNIDGYMWLKEAPIRMVLEAAERWAAEVGWVAG